MSKLSPLQTDGTYTIDFHQWRIALFCAPSPPPQPDYTGAAQAQGQANVDAARVQGKINNPNVINPYGTQTTTWGSFDQPGFDKATSDYQQKLAAYQQRIGGRTSPSPFTTALYGPAPVAPTRAQFTANADTPTLTQTFSPEQQALFDQSNATKLQLGEVAGQGAQALKGVVGTGVDFSGAPTTGNYDDTRQKVIDAYMGRANEDYAKRTDQDRSNLIAAGIRPGSKAYGDNQQMIERAKNDAYQQAEIQGGNAAAQAYNMDASRRQQAISELLAKRQTPINEITALMSGSQVSNPFSVPGYAQNAQVAPAPLFAAANQAGDWTSDMYNAQAAQAGNLQSGLFNLGGSAIMGAGMASDRRTKRGIQRIGTHALGIGIYSFRYRSRKWGKGHFIGVMADEVLQVKPEAVSRHPDGYLLVHYGQL